MRLTTNDFVRFLRLGLAQRVVEALPLDGEPGLCALQQRLDAGFSVFCLRVNLETDAGILIARKIHLQRRPHGFCGERFLFVGRVLLDDLQERILVDVGQVAA